MFHNLQFFLIVSSAVFSFKSFENLEMQDPLHFKQYVCYSTSEGLVIDGKLNEDSWEKAQYTESFIDIEGLSKAMPFHDTKVKMLWDDEFLYIAAILEEPHIWATFTERESIIFHENDFEIFIDPNGDTHNYYEIEVNALNTIWDLLLTKPYRDGGKPLTKWNVEGMKSAVFLQGTINDPSDIDEYWSVEFALPWSSLIEFATENRRPKEGEQWRINFSRVQWQRDIVEGGYEKKINLQTGKSFPEYNWVWSPQMVINMHRPETWGYIQFTETNVGSKSNDFKYLNEELCKWRLRKVYYAQKKYFQKTNSYGSLRNLINQNLIVDNQNEKLIHDFSQDSFTTRLYCADCNCIWQIRHDGQIWKKR